MIGIVSTKKLKINCGKRCLGRKKFCQKININSKKTLYQLLIEKLTGHSSFRPKRKHTDGNRDHVESEKTVVYQDYQIVRQTNTTNKPWEPWEENGK